MSNAELANPQNMPARILESFGKVLEEETNEKVTKAIRLWIRCDDTYKGIALLGMKPPCTAQTIRERFDTMDLMDTLDGLIEDMEYDIKSNAEDAA